GRAAARTAVGARPRARRARGLRARPAKSVATASTQAIKLAHLAASCFQSDRLTPTFIIIGILEADSANSLSRRERVGVRGYRDSAETPACPDRNARTPSSHPSPLRGEGVDCGALCDQIRRPRLAVPLVVAMQALHFFAFLLTKSLSAETSFWSDSKSRARCS